jgi:hypothetical protein
MDDRGSIPRRVRKFSVFYDFKIGLDTNPASYAMSAESSFPGNKAAGV